MCVCVCVDFVIDSLTHFLSVCVCGRAYMCLCGEEEGGSDGSGGGGGETSRDRAAAVEAEGGVSPGQGGNGQAGVRVARGRRGKRMLVLCSSRAAVYASSCALFCLSVSVCTRLCACLSVCTVCCCRHGGIPSPYPSLLPPSLSPRAYHNRSFLLWMHRMCKG